MNTLPLGSSKDIVETTAHRQVDERSSFVRINRVSREFRKPLSLVETALNQLGGRYRETVVHAVSDVSLSITQGRVLGLVGESGCGKSTLGRVATGLLAPTGGTVSLAGERIDLAGPKRPLKDLLRIQMIFQNPMTSLNPRQRVIDILTEGPLRHNLIERKSKTEFALHLCGEVGLPDDTLQRLPHQFSGGQRQRIGIARALSVDPDFLICDEPVAALDVSIQAQIINLLLELQKRRKLTILFISHDLSVVRHLCDEIAVMYLGRLVEKAPTEELFTNPLHPYTQALLNEMPTLTTGKRQYQPIEGEIPSPLDPPGGCHFHPRCPVALPRCSADVPPLETHDRSRLNRCWINEKSSARPNI